MTTVLSDFRESERIWVFDEVGYLLVDWSGLATNISESLVEILWYESGIVEDELNSLDVPDANIFCDDCKISERSFRSMIIELYKEMVESRST